MKKQLIITICAFLCGFTSTKSQAQNTLGKTEDLGRIVITSYVSPQIEGLPASAESMLISKMSQIASANGLGGSALNSRFIITPNITVINKDITPTAPPMHAYTLEVTFFIGDGIDGTKFASTSLEVKGAGTNETKAYISALKQINPNNSDLLALVEKGKVKIVEYYNSRCDFIIKEAQALEGQQKFDEAIYKLTGVPEVCKECFDKSMDAVAPIYQKQIDRDCEIQLTKAQNAWNSGQDTRSADEAASYLAHIEPAAACYTKAGALSKTIAARVKELDQREWNFKLKEQQDEVNIRKATIAAARDVGVAYGNNQPKSVTYNVSGWW
ncbi:MAG: hypothetical protein K9G41_01770 [Flavobacteriales bacterium]|nr:hypothetical protein [Flavobacteriales bacterium]